MAIGVVARKTQIMTDAVNRGLAELLLYVTLPFMIVVSFQMEFSRDLLMNAALLLLISLVIHTAAVFIGKALFKNVQPDKNKVLRFATVFSNCAFMGFPVLDSIYGQIGVFYGSIYVVAFNIFLWTYGIVLFTNDKDWKVLRKVLYNPGNIAVVAGVTLFYFSLRLPDPLHRMFQMVGGTTTPLSMIIVGARLANTRVRDVLTDSAVYAITLIRLIVLPLAVFFLLRLTPLDPIALGVCVLAVAMPAAANTTIFAERYHANPEFASRCVFVTTILSIVTIPLIMLVLS
jgi:predicted permease